MPFLRSIRPAQAQTATLRPLLHPTLLLTPPNSDFLPYTHRFTPLRHTRAEPQTLLSYAQPVLPSPQRKPPNHSPIPYNYSTCVPHPHPVYSRSSQKSCDTPTPHTRHRHHGVTEPIPHSHRHATSLHCAIVTNKQRHQTRKLSRHLEIFFTYYTLSLRYSKEEMSFHVTYGYKEVSCSGLL